MTYPGPPPHGAKKPMWPGFLLGLFVIAPALTFVSLVAGTISGLVLLVAVGGAFVLLFVRDPLLRGIGAGVLTAGALAVLVLFVACFQALQGH